MQIFYKLDKTHAIDVTENTTVKNILDMIMEKHKIPENCIRCVIGRRIDDTMKKCGVKENYTLYVLCGPNGYVLRI